LACLSKLPRDERRRWRRRRRRRRGGGGGGTSPCVATRGGAASGCSCGLGPCSQLRGMFTIVEMHLWCRIERLGDVACARLGSRHETALGAEGVLLRSGGPTVLVPSRHRGCGLTNATLCGEVHAGLLLDRRLLRIVISSAAVSGCTSNDSRITLKWKDVPR